MTKLLLPSMHARAAVTFIDSEHHHPLASTKWLLHGDRSYSKRESAPSLTAQWLRLELATSRLRASAL